MIVRRVLQYGFHDDLWLEVGSYSNGRLSIFLSDRGRRRLVTCTLDLQRKECPEDEVWVADYKDNTSISTWLIEHGIIKPPPTASVIIEAVAARRFKLTTSFIEELAKCGTS